MKPTAEERNDLAERLQSARRSRSLSFAALARLAGVEASQASRICRGEFVTFGDNVMRICTSLDVPLHARPGDASRDAGWDKLERSVREAWDKTPGGAERLAKVIAAVAELAKG